MGNILKFKPLALMPAPIANAELVTLGEAVPAEPARLFTCRCGCQRHKILHTGRVQCANCDLIHPDLRWERRT